MSFYVTLPSHANRREFPNNQASWFKIRLLHPLRLPGGQWQVGLSATSLPDTGVNIFDLVPEDQFVCGTSCYRMTSAGRTVRSFNLKMEYLKHNDSIVNGVTFMKSYLRWIAKTMNYAYLGQFGATDTESGKKTCPTFVWEGEDLLLDNSNVNRYKYVVSSTETMFVPHFAIHHVMAEKMGWFEKKKQRGQWITGRNLNMEFINGVVPSKQNIELKNAEGDLEYYQTTVDKNGTTWIWLSFSVNWRFVNLNVAFRSVVKEPSRSLHVYSDVAGSSIVGNRVTDLLREVMYKREGQGTIYFEPLHIQYIPLRNEVIEIIQTQVAETSGELVKFVEGNTTVTLQFKKT